MLPVPGASSRPDCPPLTATMSHIVAHLTVTLSHRCGCAGQYPVTGEVWEATKPTHDLITSLQAKASSASGT